MKSALFTNEFPPNIYGGAGVHVDYLAKFLAKIIGVEVRAFGTQDFSDGNLRAIGFQSWEFLQQFKEPFSKVLQTLSVNLAFNGKPLSADLVHCHTWYTFFAGFLAKQLYGIPLVVTMHSLEPLRPWKEEQLGPGYVLSSWVERLGAENADLVIAVSAEMKEDILSVYKLPPEKVAVIHNGIDLEKYNPVQERSYLMEQRINEPYILFVGRISRQKGILQLIDAFAYLADLDLNLVLCASAPDTPDLEGEIRRKVSGNPKIKWINEMVPKDKVIQLYSHACVFACPSIYEPFGIINLEAMACKAPVVASSVGGIKEVVVDGETGFLVPSDQPEKLAAAIRRIYTNIDLAQQFKEKARARVEAYFGWDAIARRTVKMYETVVGKEITFGEEKTHAAETASSRR